MSSTVTVQPLGQIHINNAVASAPKVAFSWSAVTGADHYKIVVWDEYPTVSSTSVYVSPDITGTSYDYAGAELVRGHAYYYSVVGFSSTDDRTASVLGAFNR